MSTVLKKNVCNYTGRNNKNKNKSIQRITKTRNKKKGFGQEINYNKLDKNICEN